METTIIQLEKSLITGTYIGMALEVIKDLALENETISGSRLEEVIFENVIFLNCNFQSTEIIECKFINCKFINCNFLFSKFINCNFIASTIENCTFCITNSLNCNFLSCCYINTTIEQSRINGSQFIDCTLDAQLEIEIDLSSNSVSMCNTMCFELAA